MPLDDEASVSEPSNTVTQPKPDRRRSNPLSKFSSYTYQLSLYMITADAYDAFVQRDRTNIELASPATNGSGAYLVAQSGGINHDVTPRAPGFVFDYHIDDLKIVQAISPKASGTASGTTHISFTITEPFGFSFMTNLKEASNMITTYDTTVGVSTSSNALKKTFILGTKILGYDENGKVVSTPSAGGVDANGVAIPDSQGMFERYWDIVITGVKHKLDGGSSIYHVTAAAKAIVVANGQKRGMIDLGATVRGRTIEDVLRGPTTTNPNSIGLFTKLTRDQESNPSIKQPNRYDVVFVGPDADLIRKATIQDLAVDSDKTQTSFSEVNSVYDVNDKTAAKAVPDLNSKEITFSKETPITSALYQLINQSSFMRNSFKKLSTTELQPDQTSRSPEVVTKDTKAPLKFFNIATKVSNPRFDVNVKDYAYDITYVIQSYAAPEVIVSNGNQTVPYYGPIKRYRYWFTGENSEIIKYEHTLNNTYFTVALSPEGTPTAHGGEADVPAYPHKRTTMNKLGKMNIGAEETNTFATQIIDPSSVAKATIEILGDPDWLIAPSPGDLNKYSQFYGPDGFSVNPAAGQVFIEIDFNEAVDYDTSLGIVRRNENILFWNYPASLVNAGLKGISYTVIKVTSSFKGGKFTQILECTVNTFGGASAAPTAAATAREDESAAETARLAASASAATPTNVGLVPDAELEVNTTPIMTNTDPLGNSLGGEFTT